MVDATLPTWPAAERNKQPILEVLKPLFREGLILELAAGTGQHAVHFASGLPGVEWQPSESDPELYEVIAARVTQAKLPNLRAPVLLDVTAPIWPVKQAAGLFCANLIHISPWHSTEGLFAGAHRTLQPGGLLVTYGPYSKAGSHSSMSNADFHDSLRAKNPDWGVRDIDDLEACATLCQMQLVDTVQMPANNLCLLWQRLTDA
jgi:hypothetical protein